MRRRIDCSCQLVDFEGKPIKVDSKVFTLKDGLMTYIRNAGRMGLNEEDQNIAYTLGFLLGPAEGPVELTTAQYDVIKKICDHGKVTTAPSNSEAVYGIEVRLQMKELVDKAEMIEEDKK